MQLLSKLHALRALGRNQKMIAQARKDLAEAEEIVVQKEMQLRVLLADRSGNDGESASSMPKTKAARTA